MILDKTAFATKWAQVNSPGSGVIETFKANTLIPPNLMVDGGDGVYSYKAVIGAKITAMHYALLHNVDPNPNNFVGCSVINTAGSRIGNVSYI